MKKTIRILHLEDDPIDSELALEVLRQERLPAEIRRVDTLEDFREALESQDPSLVLSDYSLPGTDPEEALLLARQTCPDIPFIFLSGTMGEEKAVDLLHKGASDCVLKQNLGRLVPAIRRLLQESQETARRRRAEEALRESEERFRTLADNIPQLAWMADPDGAIFWFNRRWLEFTGASMEEMKGGGWRRIPHPDHLGEVLEKIRDALASGEPWEATFPMRRHDGAYRWFLTRATPIRDEAGKVLRWFGTNTDVTEQREAGQAIQKAREAAEAASRAKSEFLANMSHELRTPMTVIMGAVEQLLKGGPAPAERRLLEMADGSARRLMGIIEDLLDISRIGAKELKIEEKPFDLRRCVRQVAERFAAPAKEKGLVLGWKATPDIPVEVIGDPGRLEQVLTNLVSNAVKFTEKGEVTVSVEAAGGGVTFTVRDTGIGIPSGALAGIFHPFTQADSSRTRPYGGAGLGLAIAREVAELMGGSLRAESTPGQGSVFTLVLPLAPVPCADPLPSSQGETEAKKRPARILLAEDDSMVREMVRMVLLRRGYEVSTAENGREAVSLWQQGRTDLVLMDLQMPVMDGIEASRRIRALETGNAPRTPILALTAHARQEDREECLAAGMDGFLTKPIKMEELYRTIDGSLPEKRP